MIDIQQSLGIWIPQVNGQYVNEDWNPENKGFGAQCWDTAAHWSRFLGLPVINTGGPGRWPGWAGNMVDAFPQTDAIAAAYELIGPDHPMLPGDIVVWGDSYWYYPATHVAVGIQDKGGWKLCMSQNSTSGEADNPYPEWTSGPTTLQHLPSQGLLGFIRPRVGTIALQGTITPVKEIPVTTEDKMLVLATNGSSPQVWAGDGILRRPVWTLDTMNAQQWLARNKVLGPFYKDGEIQTIPDLNSIGIDITALVGKDVNGRG
jgi:hypothetical protein